MRTTTTMLLLTATLAACGGGGSALEGIYTPDVWTENTTACDAPGTDVLAAQDPLYFVTKSSFAGTSYLTASGCTDQPDCVAQASEDIVFGEFVFDHGSDGDGWHGTLIFSFGPDANGECAGGVVTHLLTADGDTAISIRSETVDVPSFAPDGAGDCTTEDAEAASAGLPCTSLETAHLTFTAEL